MNKLPFIFKFKNMNRVSSSSNGKVKCWYNFVDNYVVAIIESIDRMYVEKHCALFSNYGDMVKYIEDISK